MKRKTVYHLAFAVAAAAMFVTSAPLRALETDDKIESSFKKTYVYVTYLKDDAVKIEAKEGVVTLTGTVAEESHKALAGETVAGLPGVTRVDNQLAITTAVPVHADLWIRRKVILALQFHRTIDLSNIFVAVDGGVVTLTGQASSTAQRELTVEYAKDIDGVREVRNEMTVAATPNVSVRVPGDRLDDASISAEIRTVLMTHSSTQSINARVATRNGEVTLCGIAKNDAERALVGKIAADIWGVIHVKNQMTVEHEPK